MTGAVLLPSPWEEPIQTRLTQEGGQIIGESIQPGATVMLEGIQTIRDNRLAKSFDWGRAELEIPHVQLLNLQRKYPDLASPDQGIKLKAWKQFLRNPESLPYRVRQQGRFQGRSVGGI